METPTFIQQIVCVYAVGKELGGSYETNVEPPIEDDGNPVLRIFGVPTDQLVAVEDRAYAAAEAALGNFDVPIEISTHPETEAEFYSGRAT